MGFFMASDELKKALDIVFDKLKEQGLLQELGGNSPEEQQAFKEGVLKRTMTNLENGGVALTPDDLKNRANVLKLVIIMVNAAVAQEYDPKNEGLYKLHPENRKNCQKAMTEELNQVFNKANMPSEGRDALIEEITSNEIKRPSAPTPKPGSGKVEDDLRAVIVAEAGTAVMTENRLATASKSVDTIESMMARGANNEYGLIAGVFDALDEAEQQKDRKSPSPFNITPNPFK